MRSDLVERARAGKLKLEEMERGTFTISSLAQFDITFFTAILNPPQSGILSVGKMTDQLFLKEGQVFAKKIARFGLSVDHRIIDGAVAAAFLQSLKKRLESPMFTFMDL
jgi:pyruvate dehydrogenase E2 component (dihydrolipoamide acetyltransferase)